MGNPETFESETELKTDQPTTMSIFDKIEVITILLNQESLEDNELEQLNQLLTEITEETLEMEGKLVSFFQDEVFNRLKQIIPDHPFFNYIEGNEEFIDSIDLLIGGQESYERILANIKDAQKSIHITMFVWRDDIIGNKIAKELLDAASRGVKVTIQKDALASIFEYTEQNRQTLFHKDFDKTLSAKRGAVDKMYAEDKAYGVYKQNPNPLIEGLLNHENISIDSEIREDHSKYFIFDNETLITGGVNIGDEYASGEFHDYMVEMKSPILVDKFCQRLSVTDDFDIGSSIEFTMNVKKGQESSFEIKNKFLELLGGAKDRIIIEMAYFGDEEITQEIIKAAKKGVKVDLILPGNANVQDSWNKLVIQELLDATEGTGNLSVYFYPKMVHAKVVNIDGEKTFMGSANMNPGAMEKLGETNILVNDPNCDFTQEMLDSLKNDIKASKKVTSPPPITYDRMKAFMESKFS
ncbi:phosphatidylserine/phosphatidylglycerophosphate/cardiolipin synthase family protein [Patescibacteria group bacterium]